MAEVEIGLGAVFGHEYFAVLKRAHRAGVDVDVGIELEEGDFEAARFEDRGEGSGGDTFAKGGHHAAGDENIFGHRWVLAGKTDYTVKAPSHPAPASDAPYALSPALFTGFTKHANLARVRPPSSASSSIRCTACAVSIGRSIGNRWLPSIHSKRPRAMRCVSFEPDLPNLLRMRAGDESDRHRYAVREPRAERARQGPVDRDIRCAGQMRACGCRLRPSAEYAKSM